MASYVPLTLALSGQDGAAGLGRSNALLDGSLPMCPIVGIGA